MMGIGFITSVDDYYVTGAGLTVVETTNGDYNGTSLRGAAGEGVLMSWVCIGCSLMCGCFHSTALKNNLFANLYLINCQVNA